MIQNSMTSVLSKTMRGSYESLSRSEGDADIIPYFDDEKQAHPITAATIIELRHERAIFLKKSFVWLSIAILFIFTSTTAIVITGRSQIQHVQTSTHQHAAIKSAPSDPEIERQRKLAIIPTSVHPPKNSSYCGPDVKTAMAKGCHFDMISFTWVPHECYDPDLTEEFLNLKAWQWSVDSNGTEFYTREQMESGTVERGFVTFDYHITHCLYTWKKLVRRLDTGGALDWYLVEYEHVKHCGRLLLQEGDDRQEFNSEWFALFPKCGYL